MKLHNTLNHTIFAAALAAANLLAAPAAVTNERPAPALPEKVRHELAMLPYYGPFDHLAFSVDGGTVVLTGHVSRPTLRSDAERVVARVAGVEGVINRVEVLPLSSFDDSIRLRVARAVYGASALNRYALGANPAIRIIVRNGEVTLEGSVAAEFDRNLANLAANGVAGVFKVTNNLRVENPAPRKA